MWRLLPIALLGCLLLVTAFGGAQTVLARSFEFEQLLVQAEVLPDGSLLVQEHRTVMFSGAFSGMFQWIRKQPGVEITDVVVSENGEAYLLRPGATEPGPANTYYIEESPDQLYIDWSYGAMDERRTFTISYRVLQQVQVHADVAELFYQFVGSQWDQGVRRVEVVLTLPEGASESELRAWGHGPLHGEVQIVDARTVRWTIDDLPARTFLEGRVTFPPQLITGDRAVFTGVTALPGILAEEQGWADQANRARQRAQLIVGLRRFDPLGAIIGLLLAAFLIWRARQASRPYATSFQGDYYRELPGDYPPAELGVLWRFGDPTTDDFTATILDLARRRYFRIDEYTQQGAGLLGGGTKPGYRLSRLENREELTAPERNVLELLFEQISADHETVTFDEIERYAKSNPTSFQTYWQGWVGSVRFNSERHNFFDNSTELAAGRSRQLIAAVLLIAVGLIAIMGVQMYLTGGGLIVGALGALVSGATMQRCSPAGQEDYVRWQAFRRFLQHFSQMDRHGIPSLVIWEHYLVYAVTLGVAKEVLSQLEIVFPNLEADGYRFGYGWYYFGAGYIGMHHLTRGMHTMTTSLNQSIQTSLANAAASLRSSGGGAGGGFSGGGGFGGGGGGGGVR